MDDISILGNEVLQLRRSRDGLAKQIERYRRDCEEIRARTDSILRTLGLPPGDRDAMRKHLASTLGNLAQAAGELAGRLAAANSGVDAVNGENHGR